MKVDFHCHTCYSPDGLNTLPALIKKAKQRGLDRIVITDHNTIQGALLARQMDPEFIIIGEEIQTTQGELLAAFVSQEVPKGLSPLDTIGRLRAQGAFISVSHPFDVYRSGWPLQDLEEISPLVDAIEIFNARVLHPWMNDDAMEFAREHQLAGTAGSDAHALREIGQAALEIPEFQDAESLRSVIRKARVVGKISPSWVHLFSSWAKIKKRFFPPQQS